MKVVGITGGIGAGKSMILKMLNEQFYAHVIITDEVAHRLMEPGKPGYEVIIKTFGTGLLNEDLTINKQKLSELIFHEKAALDQVNSIIHPMVWAEVEKEIAAVNSGLVVVESAIMDQEHDDIYDEIWYVYTSRENRLRRLAGSRGYSEEKSLSIMAGQPSEAEFRANCDRVIDNNGTEAETEEKLRAICLGIG